MRIPPTFSYFEIFPNNNLKVFLVLLVMNNIYGLEIPELAITQQANLTELYF